jgi:hypothetical protein
MRGRLRGQPVKGLLQLQTIKVLKGEDLPANFEYSGTLATDPDFPPSDPNSLAEAHPQAFEGACNRHQFIKDSLVVFFFVVGSDGKLHGTGGPFSRINEDVPDPNALWVQAIQNYRRIQLLPTESQKYRALIDLRSSLRGTPTPGNRELAADIDRHLGSGTTYRPEKFALAQLNDPKGELNSRIGALASLAAANHPSAKREFAKLIASDKEPAYLGVISRYLIEQKRYEALERLLRDKMVAGPRTEFPDWSQLCHVIESTAENLDEDFLKRASSHCRSMGEDLDLKDAGPSR